MWVTFEQARTIIETDLSKEAEAIGELFDLSDQVVLALAKSSHITACRIGAFALLKARRLATGAYLLSLNCLAQEGGALFRLLQEAWEFLIYVAEDPSRAEAVAEGKKPSAGTIAKAIEGKFKDMRDHLNTHSAHLSFTYEAMGHLFDPRTGGLRVKNQPDAAVIKKNMGPMFGLMFLALGEGISLLSLADEAAFSSFGSRHAELQKQAYGLFKGTTDGLNPSEEG